MSLARMGALSKHLDDLARVPSRAAKAVAEGLTGLLAEQFAAGVDPYGKPWAPLAERTLRRHGPPPLTDSGTMADGTVVRPRAGAGVVIDVPFPGGIHQTGAKRGAWRMPARKILPEGAKLPAAWRRVIEASVAASIKGGSK